MSTVTYQLRTSGFKFEGTANEVLAAVTALDAVVHDAIVTVSEVKITQISLRTLRNRAKQEVTPNL